MHSFSARLAVPVSFAFLAVSARAQEAPAPPLPAPSAPPAGEDIRERIGRRVEALLREHRDRMLEEVRRAVADELRRAEEERRRREAELRARVDQVGGRVRDIARRVTELKDSVERALAQADQALGEKGKEEAGPAKPGDGPRAGGPRAGEAAHPPRPEEKPVRKFFQTLELYESGAYEKAIEGFVEVAKTLATLRSPEARVYRAMALYREACSHSVLGQSDQALKTLEAAVRSGFRDLDLLENDAELDGLREDPRFDKLVRLARSIRG